VRVVKTASGARAVQIVYSNRGGKRDLEHVGSAHTDADLEVLKAAARQRIAAGQPELDLGLQPRSDGGGSLPITAARMGPLLDALGQVYKLLGFEDATGDDVFRALVIARLIEPTSKLDSIRVLEEAGLTPPSYRTITRALPRYATEDFRARLASACASRALLGPAALMLYDASTLYFEEPVEWFV
jgi:hypothetical protein